MVNDFLKKYQEELITEKIQLKEDIDLLETKIKEETKFLSILEESNESYFKEFTPRDVNAKNNEKALEVKGILENLQAEMNYKAQRMKFYDGRLTEINALINNKMHVNVPKPSNKAEVTADSSDELVAKLSEVKELILLDPYRAQLELDKIISNI